MVMNLQLNELHHQIHHPPQQQSRLLPMSHLKNAMQIMAVQALPSLLVPLQMNNEQFRPAPFLFLLCSLVFSPHLILFYVPQSVLFVITHCALLC